MISFDSTPKIASSAFWSPDFAASINVVLASSGEANTLNEGLLALLLAARTMISGKSGNDFVTTILQAFSNITVLQLVHYGHFTDTTHQTSLRFPLHHCFTS